MTRPTFPRIITAVIAVLALTATPALAADATQLQTRASHDHEHSCACRMGDTPHAARPEDKVRAPKTIERATDGAEAFLQQTWTAP